MSAEAWGESCEASHARLVYLHFPLFYDDSFERRMYIRA